jgi:CRP-like cAMP-binding protein
MMPIGDEFQAGQYFGEMSLLGGHRVENDICAVNESTLIALDVETFESVLGPYTKLLEAHYNTAVMAQVPSLRKLTGAELKRLNGVLLPARHQAGAVLVQEGDVLNKLVFIVSGSAVMEGKGVAGKDKRDPYEQIEVRKKKCIYCILFFVRRCVKRY